MNRLTLVLCATPVAVLSLSLRTQAQVGLGHHPPIAWLTPNKFDILATQSGPMTLQLLTELAPSGGHP